MRLRSIVAVVMVLVVGFAAITLTALEGNEVVVVRTHEATGGVRETRVWVAEQERELKRLRLENDILKKAAAYFARNQA